MSAAAVMMMVFMLGVYFGGFVYFALKKPRRPASRKSEMPPPGPIATP